jgi:3'(2'), 5'-bisphosphate nucleotidase
LVERFLRSAERAAARAGAAVSAAAGGPVKHKQDGSVSIAADAAADAAAAEVLAELGLPLLSEERPDPGLADHDDPWLVVDPLDGTGNFLAGLPPWAFSVGLVVGSRPVAGYVVDLSSGRHWWGGVGFGACRDGVPVSPRPGGTAMVPTPPPDGATVVPPGFRRLRITGCTAVDLCLVADGAAGGWHDLDRQGTHVHDVAGALGVLVAAGASILDPEGQELILTPDTERLIRFCAAADRATAERRVEGHRPPAR